MTRLATLIATFALAIGAAHSLELQFPVACSLGQDCFVQNYVDQDPSDGARDHHCGTLSYNGHNGTDIRLPSTARQKAGVDVLAAADGQVLRTRDGIPDISVRAAGKAAVEGKECGNGVVLAHENGFETQYCHMAQGSIRVRSGDTVKAGEPIGRVGLSGNTEYPHLHMTVRQRGELVDPFAFEAPPGTCGAGKSLWAASVQPLLAYKPRAILNTGFAPAPVTMDAIEAGEAGKAPVDTGAPALVAFVRTIGLKKGDVQHLKLIGPDERTIVENAAPALDRDKAQAMVFAGRKRPAAGWQPGTYRASYAVERGGATVLEETFATTISP